MPLAAADVHRTMQRAASGTYPNGSERAGTYTLTFRLRMRTDQTQVLKEHHLVLMPTSFSKRTEARVSVYYTAQDLQVDVPPHAVGKTVFQITGHTGYASVVQGGSGNMLTSLAGPNALQAFGAIATNAFATFTGDTPASQQRTTVDGAAAVKDLQDTFLAYLDPSWRLETSAMASTQDMLFEFLDWTAPTSADDPVGQRGWEITPEGAMVDLRQDASKPFLYFYSVQFTGIRPLAQTVPDPPIRLYTQKQWTLRDALKKMTAVVTDLTNGVNTVKFAFDQLFIQNVSGPITTYLLSTAQLSDAIESVATGVADKIAWPLYAQRLQTNPLEVAKHSVSTLKAAGEQFASMFTLRSLGQTLGLPLGTTTPTTTTGQDAVTMQLNGEAPRTYHLGAQSGGPQVAAAVQAAVRAQTPDAQANTQAYRGFTAQWDEAQQQFVFTSGTTLSPAAQVHIVTPVDPVLTPDDASAALGLGTVHGAHEQQGTDVAVRALTLLQGQQEACTHLLALPDLFASQLHAEDTALVAHYPETAVRTTVQGSQRLTQVQVLPGDSLQTVGARVGVPWEALALVNHLSYPFLVEAPTELLRGRASGGDRYHLVGSTPVTPNQYQGRRLDTIGGTGAGQSRTILQHDTLTYLIDLAWRVVPDSTTDFAIRDELNPILQTGTVTSATAQTLTDSSLALVPDAQAGLPLLMTSGGLTGLRRRIVDHDGTTYILDRPAPVAPVPGDTYAVLAIARRSPPRYKLIGEALSVPRATGRPLGVGVLSRLEDVSTITGRTRSRDEQLFGRDWLLVQGSLVYDPTARDLVTVAGRENLRQAATHLIVLPFGQLAYSSLLGSYVQQELAQSATLASQQRLLHSAQRTLMEDARIDGVLQEQLLTSGGRSYLTLGIRAIAGETVGSVVIR